MMLSVLRYDPCSPQNFAFWAELREANQKLPDFRPIFERSLPRGSRLSGCRRSDSWRLRGRTVNEARGSSTRSKQRGYVGSRTSSTDRLHFLPASHGWKPGVDECREFRPICSLQSCTGCNEVLVLRGIVNKPTEVPEAFR